MRLVGQFIGGIVVNAILVVILALLGMFVWNTGVVGLIPSLNEITFPIASAIMTGIVILNLVAKIWYKRIAYTKQEKEMLKKIFEVKK